MADNDKAKRPIQDGPLGVKWMAAADKVLITDAAKRAKRTVGDWLGEAAREKVQREREDHEDSREMHILPPLAHQPLAGGAVPDVQALHAMLDLMERLSQYRGGKAQGRPNGRYLAAVHHMLAAQLGMALPEVKPPQAKPKQIAADHPPSEQKPPGSTAMNVVKLKD